MLMHHIVHTILIFSCCVANMDNPGVLTLFLHSFSDIFLQSSKTLNLLGHMRGLGFGVFAVSHISWIWMRLFSFPMLLYNIRESMAMNVRDEFSHLQTYLNMNEIFLSCLVAMHFYWYFLMVKISWRVISKGVVKDTHNDVAAECEGKDKQKAPVSSK